MRIVLLLLMVLPLVLHAQFTYVADQTIPVRDVGGNTLAMPWAGGLNAAQYNTMDLNGDGKDDLVLFDRMANKVITYLNINNHYRYTPTYENFFPSEITNWVLLRDFNCDGRKDLFTGDVLGMKVYTNVTPAGGNPAWQQFFFFPGGSGTKSPVVLTKGFSGMINLQLQYDDLPSISDVDGDGDLDILNVRFVGNGTVEFHQNFSKERYGTCDSLAFERITQQWGGFTECNCGSFAFNSEDCPPNGGGRTQHAGGKSLLALDVDGDQDQDLIFSESSCTRLYQLSNTGTSENAIISSSSNFPDVNPVNFLVFPAAFFEDVDFDGKKDLIASPNIYGKEFLNMNLRQSNWFYKNTGTNTTPNFTLTKTNFLQEHMIDVGDNAVPAFADYDGDGDLDLFISQNGTENYVASVYLYKNIGNREAPEFQLETTDYLGVSNVNLFNLKLQLIDINGDNTIDFVFTATSFQTGVTSLYYVSNSSTSTFNFPNPSLEATGFTVSRSENIHITDVNSDGLPDLLVGKNNGALEYWKNNGPKGSFTFVLEDESFLNLAITVLRQSPMCATGDLDADGKVDLVIGDQSGVLKIIANYREAENANGAITDLIFNDLVGAYIPQNMGGRSWPTIANIFNTNKPAIVVGNILGGVHVLRHDEGESLPEQPVVTLYPNPVEGSGILNIKLDRYGYFEIFSSLGQRISDPITLQANQLNAYRFSFLAKGVYLFRFTANNKSITRRIVVY
ncbi:MAG: T9SS type A sorting domain-containing protein [Cyclobacteriaceae bacterium]|nr:T9SS type A sorting domain-containing protein [Cyclobacteriaceae bacterium]